MKKIATLVIAFISMLYTSSKACEAHFTYTVDGYTINLDGSSSAGDISSWNWYIDGDIFSDAGPETHKVVDSDGEYHICLVIKTIQGCVDTFCQTVNVLPEPGCEACFSFSVDGFTIHFDGSCSAGDVTHWEWFANDDLFSDSGPTTSLTVAGPGTKNFCLVITTASGCVDTFCHEIEVESGGDCQAHFTYTIDGSTINLDGLGSTGDVVSWHWFINEDLFSDDGPETHVVVTDSGEYEICLVIETASGCVDTFCNTINFEQEGDCEACFHFTVDGFTIHFDGSCSVGDVTHWQWFANDDLFSNDGPATSLTVSGACTKNICLIITTASGCIDTACQEVVVEGGGNCEACFSFSVDGFTIHFDGSCSVGDVTHWQWFSDGDPFSDDGPTTSYTVDAAGTQHICLVITTASGCVDTLCKEVVVEGGGNCEACFSFTVDGFTIHFDGSCSVDDVTHWQWFADGDLFSDDGPTTSYTADAAGTQHICLVITTASGCVDTLCKEVVVEGDGNCEACFHFTVDGSTIHFDGSCSVGDVIHWQWFANGDQFSDDGPETTFEAEAGTENYCLVIITASGCIDTICKEITVEEQPDCHAAFTYTIDGNTIYLDGSSSSDDIVSWLWTLDGDIFSDSHPGTHVTVDGAGEYEVCLIIETSSGCVDTFCTVINVEGVPDDCEAHFTYEIDGETIFLNGSSSSGDVVSWHWFNGGDMFSDDGPEAHTTVGDAGDYEICLVIETADGCVDTFCQTVTVEQLEGDYEFKLISSGQGGSFNIQIFSPQQGSFTFTITDLSGKKLLGQSAELDAGTWQYLIPLGDQLSMGVYLVNVNFNGEKIITQKLSILKD